MLKELLGEIRSYPAMLTKLAFWAFVSSLVVTLLVATRVHWVSQLVKFGPFSMKTIGLDLSVGAFLPAIGAAIASQMLPLHDVISDVLGIRRRFDVFSILEPLAAATGAAPRKDLRKLITNSRAALMRQVFYPYVSPVAAPLVVDPHLVHMALTSWSWFWVFLEGSFFVLTGAIILLIDREYNWALAFGVIIIALALLMLWPYSRSANYADEEIREIASDPMRAATIRLAFDAL